MKCKNCNSYGAKALDFACICISCHNKAIAQAKQDIIGEVFEIIEMDNYDDRATALLKLQKEQKGEVQDGERKRL